MSIIRTLPEKLTANPARVVIRHFQIATEPRSLHPVDKKRVQRIIDNVCALDARTIQSELGLVMADFRDRHRQIAQFFEARYASIAPYIDVPDGLNTAERQLIGAYFCNEYSFEAAALMNPSVVPHPDQSDVPEGSIRFLLSLRAVGEGHISSITFREGVLSADGTITLEPQSSFAVAATPDIQDDKVFVACTGNECPHETVIFPVTEAQRNGLEDLRLVPFTEDGRTTYYGTYTAYSGTAIGSEMLITDDFKRFELRPLSGSASRNKGMGLFPRKVNGMYMMIGRQDNENLYLLTSDNLYDWNDGVQIAGPKYPWELVQMGNCGAPIELDEGWLLLTHGVGAVRKYAIGAMLLDKDDPSKVLGRSHVPLLSPSDAEREGYVPNVVYTCGALVHNNNMLFLPYGIADSAVGFATIKLDDLLKTLT